MEAEDPEVKDSLGHIDSVLRTVTPYHLLKKNNKNQNVLSGLSQAWRFPKM
jgi:hypothetical protein